MAAATIKWLSFLRSTNSLCFSSVRRCYYVSGKVSHGFLRNATAVVEMQT